MDRVVFLDNHSTTRVDRRVVEEMLPYFEIEFGNAGSITHAMGRRAAEAVATARTQVADELGCQPDELIFTSGATESNNLALRGLLDEAVVRGDVPHVISVVTEHRAVLDPLRRLASRGVDVTWLDVTPCSGEIPGQIRLTDVANAIRPETVLVSVMWANNEIGVVQPMAELVELCHAHNIRVHSDATQAVGKIAIDLSAVPVDLVAFSAHKFHGPKGVGGLVVRDQRPRLRLRPLCDGGGQERGLRSGTLNVPGIVGMAAALRLCGEELDREPLRLATLRNRLYNGLVSELGDAITLNGPPLDLPVPGDGAAGSIRRLPGNLNLLFRRLEGESLMLLMPDIAVSSGSACTAAEPEPSHVLQALGRTEDEARSSLRFGLGRFTTDEQITVALGRIVESVHQLRDRRV